jgi:hypothetical protein
MIKLAFFNGPLRDRRLTLSRRTYDVGFWPCADSNLRDIFVTKKQHINTLCLGHHHIMTIVLIILTVSSHLYCLDVQLTNVLMFCMKLIIMTRA